MHRKRMTSPALLLAVSAALPACQKSTVTPLIDVNCSRAAAIVPAEPRGEMTHKQRVRELFTRIRQGSQDGAFAALKELEKIADPASVPILLEALGGRSYEAKSAAIHILGNLKARQAVLPLMGLMGDDASLAQLTIDALGKIGDRRAVSAVLSKLDDDDPTVQMAAIDALGELGDIRAGVPLAKFLKHKEPVFRLKAVRALGKLADTRAIQDMIPLLADKSQPVRFEVTEAFGKMGEPAVEPLIGALFFDDFRISAMEALANIGPVAVRLLTEGLKHPDKKTVYGIATALGNIGDPSAVPALSEALSHPDANVRGTVANALRKIGDRRALLALSKAMETEQNAFAKAAAEAAVEEISNR